MIHGPGRPIAARPAVCFPRTSSDVPLYTGGGDGADEAFSPGMTGNFGVQTTQTGRISEMDPIF